MRNEFIDRAGVFVTNSLLSRINLYMEYCLSWTDQFIVKIPDTKVKRLIKNTMIQIDSGCPAKAFDDTRSAKPALQIPGAVPLCCGPFMNTIDPGWLQDKHCWALLHDRPWETRGNFLFRHIDRGCQGYVLSAYPASGRHPWFPCCSAIGHVRYNREKKKKLR